MTEAEQLVLIERMTSAHGADCTGMSFRNWPVELFDGKTIINCCLYQEDKPDCQVFPPPMTGVIFKRCNLDNVFIPPGNTVVTTGWEACCQKRIMVQPPTPKAHPKPDDEPDICVDWIVDVDNKPVEPMDRRRFEEEGRSLDPRDIPEHHVIEVTMTTVEYMMTARADWEAEAAVGNKPLKGKHQWFREVPEVIETIIEETIIEVSSARWEQMKEENDWQPFDSRPVVAEVKPTSVLLHGPITFHTVRGKAWLIRGQKATDVRPRVSIGE